MRSKFLILAGALLLVGAGLAWFAGLGDGRKNLSDSRFSDLYTQALAQGKAHLLIEPHPAVLASADPFTAPEAKQHLVSDASLYRGHYYLYFGIAPFATVLVPWFLLTGKLLSAAGGVVVFILLGHAAYGTMLWLWVRATRPNLPSRWLLAAFLVIVVASGTWPLLGRPAIYELENAAAHAFLALALTSLLLAELSPRRSWSLALAGGLAACTMGCRPNYFPAVSLISLWVLVRGWQHSPTGAGFAPRAARVLGIALPLMLVAIGLAWWNYHRFGTPTEFGLKYTVTQNPALTRPLTEWANVPYSLHRYLVGGAHLGPYFPFIQAPEAGPFPLAPRQEHSDQLYGILLISTVLIGLLFAFRANPRIPRPFLVLLAAVSVGNLGFLVFIPMNCYRYPADFLGPVAWLAAVGWLQAADARASRWRWLVGTALGLTLGYSAAAVTCQTFSIAQTHTSFDTRRPDDFARVARPFNQAAYVLERLTGHGPAAVAMSFTLPAQPSGPNEPLAVLGTPGAEDFLFVNYVRPGVIVLGYESTGQGGLRSALIELDPAQEHRLELHSGSLLPPGDHPSLRHTPAGDLALARQLVVVSLDGKVVIDGRVAQHRPRGRIQLGRSPDNAAFGSTFSGRLQVRRAPLHPLVSPDRWQQDAYGPLRLTADLVPLPAGVCDPLLSLGLPGQGAQLLAEHQADGSMKLIWLDAARRQLACTIPNWPMRQPVELEIQSGSLLPPPDSPLWPRDLGGEDRLRLRRTVRVILGGKTVLEGEIEPVETAPALLALGRDPLVLRGGVMPASPGKVTIAARLTWP